jgi:hypothetical protein
MAAQRRPSLGKTDDEDEAGHLRRVADELGGANSDSVQQLADRLHRSAKTTEKLAAAAELGAQGDRHAIAILRALLEQSDPAGWEIAVHGLRQSRDRAGWLSLESVALDHVGTLEDGAGVTGAVGPPHAFRLLVMGRTKTMDRLFRAIDGHSRSLTADAAKAFAHVAVNSIPGEMAIVMAMRLGIGGSKDSRPWGHPATPQEVSRTTGLGVDEVRLLEGLAWETVQRSRPYREIRQNYEVNLDRLRTAD